MRIEYADYNKVCHAYAVDNPGSRAYAGTRRALTALRRKYPELGHNNKWLTTEYMRNRARTLQVARTLHAAVLLRYISVGVPGSGHVYINPGSERDTATQCSLHDDTLKTLPIARYGHRYWELTTHSKSPLYKMITVYTGRVPNPNTVPVDIPTSVHTPSRVEDKVDKLTHNISCIVSILLGVVLAGILVWAFPLWEGR